MWKTYYVMRPNFDGKQVRSEIGKYDPLFIYIKEPYSINYDNAQ